MAQLLFQPLQVEVAMKLLTDVSAGKSRYQLEVYDASTRELLAMRSRPFHNNCSIGDALTHASGWLRSALHDLGLAEPF